MKRPLAIFLLMTLIQMPVTEPGLAKERHSADESVYFFEQDKKFYAGSEYEYSRVSIGPVKTDWSVLSHSLLYRTGRYTPYLHLDYHERGGEGDFSLGGGIYLRFDQGYLQVENGFGMDADFLYRYQLLGVYEHRLAGNLYGRYGARYQHRKTGDVFISSPGTTYYWGDHFLTVSYHTSVMEGGSAAHSGSVQANWVLHRKIHIYGGGVLGQRLFDVLGVPSDRSRGYILFAGMRLRLHERLQTNTGFSYSEEEPGFIKRSLTAGLTLKLG